VRIIRRIKGMVLATAVIGEQTLNASKAREVAQKVAPSPGSAVSSVTSAHDVTRQGFRPNPRIGLYFKLKIMTCKIQNDSSPASFQGRRAVSATISLERDEISLNRHRAPGF
jgi:hypothetical protein